MDTKLQLRVAIALLELAGIAVWHLMRLRKDVTPENIYKTQESTNNESRYLVAELREELSRY